MEKLLTKIIESWIIFNEQIYWPWIHEIVASNILESGIWETLVKAVCKWIKMLADEEWITIQQAVEDILDEDSDLDSYEMD